ncbi:MAG: hypothetical protein WBH90_17285 [Aggregatilineales bacterium]
MSEHTLPSPTLQEFQSWPSEKVEPIARGKTVVLASGGSSRWYFLEHGDTRKGYTATEQFRDYGRRGLQRIVEQASMMLDDGISTVFAPGFAGGQGERNPEYVENLKWAYQVLINEDAQALYEQHRLGVLFRGSWRQLFERLDAPDLSERYEAVEAQTKARSERWLVWFVAEDFIPESLLPTVTQSLVETGKMPERVALSEQYYGRPLDIVDIFISNNKFNVAGMVPPLLRLNDLYFTVSPSFYMDRPQWRNILYDHIFARRGHYRDYTKLTPEAVEDMREFYRINRGVTMGVGSYHEPSQTWRPTPFPVQRENHAAHE